jgi:hypothetical protein
VTSFTTSTSLTKFRFTKCMSLRAVPGDPSFDGDSVKQAKEPSFSEYIIQTLRRNCVAMFSIEHQSHSMSRCVRQNAY